MKARLRSPERHQFLEYYSFTEEMTKAYRSLVTGGSVMDSFEHVVGAILARQGFWVVPCMKVELTKEDKARIKRKSCPRWELDVVGYQGATNTLRVLECKSYLDSTGVQVETFRRRRKKDAKRYKLFFNDAMRQVIFDRLVSQLVAAKQIRPRPRVEFGLAAGKIKGDEAWLSGYFSRKGWILWLPSMIKKELESMGKKGSLYENSVEAVVAKLLLR